MSLSQLPGHIVERIVMYIEQPQALTMANRALHRHTQSSAVRVQWLQRHHHAHAHTHTHTAAYVEAYVEQCRAACDVHVWLKADAALRLRVRAHKLFSAHVCALLVARAGPPLLHTALLLACINNYPRPVQDFLRAPSNDAPLTAMLLTAILHSSKDVLRLLLDYFSAHNLPYKTFGSSSSSGALHFACCVNSSSSASILLNYGCNPDGENLVSPTPLHIAITHSPDSVPILLLHNANPELKSDGLNALHMSVSNPSLVSLILTKHPHLISSLSDDTQSALHYAAHSGNLASVQLLLQLGAEINAADSQGTTPLFRALEGTSKQTHIADYLIKQGCDVYKSDSEGWTAAHYCARWGYTALLRKLVDLKVDLNKCDVDGWSVLHCACKGGNLDIVRMIVPYVDVSVVDNEGWGPLHFAADSGEDPVEIVKILIARGAEPGKSKSGLTPLHLCCRWGFPHSATVLKNYVQVDGLGRTVLMMACKGGNLECVEIVKPLCDVNAVDLEGQSVLHYLAMAVISEQSVIDILNALESPTLKLNLRDNSGATALLHAIKLNKLEVAGKLVEMGADVSLTFFGSNIFHYLAQGSATDYQIKQFMEQVNVDIKDLNVVDPDGDTPLLRAIRYGKSGAGFWKPGMNLVGMIDLCRNLGNSLAEREFIEIDAHLS